VLALRWGGVDVMADVGRACGTRCGDVGRSWFGQIEAAAACPAGRLGDFS